MKEECAGRPRAPLVMKHESTVGIIDRNIGKEKIMFMFESNFAVFFRAVLEGSEKICS